MPAAPIAQAAQRRAGMRAPKLEPPPIGAGVDIGASAGMPMFLQCKGIGKDQGTTIDSSDDEELLGAKIPRESIQAETVIGAPDDPLEHEADRVAEVVTRKDRVEPRAAAPAHRKPVGTTTLPGVDAGLSLADSVRQRVEPVLGADLGNVRVHTGAEAARAAQAIDARAFTHKNHVWLGADESADNTELLAHEATHVLHQSDRAGLDDAGDRAPAPAIQRQRIPHDSSSPAVARPESATTPEAPSTDGTGSPETAARERPDVRTDESSSRASDGIGDAAGADAGTSADAGGGGAEGSGPGGASGPQADGGSAGGEGGEAVSPEEDIDGAPAPMPVPETGDGALGTGDVALIDEELAEHERWAGSFGALGTAGSDERARFLLDRAGQGAASGLSGGLGMGFAMGAVGAAIGQIAGRRLATLAVSRGATAVPVPGLGPAIGGVMAVAGLAMRDWGATADTIGRIGTGEGYEGLANDLEGIAEILDVASSIMDVVGGVLGGIAVGMWVGAVLSAGALSPLALTLSAIATGISLATTAIGIIISIVVRPAVTALRALHAFESQGDPTQIEADGAMLQAAAAQVTGAVGGAIGGRVGGAAGTRGGARIDRGVTALAARRTGGRAPMSATAGPGPRVHVEVPEAPSRVVTDTSGSPPHTTTPDAPIAGLRPAATDGPTATAPRRRRAIEPGIDRRQVEIVSDIVEAQRLASSSTPDNESLGSLPGRPGSHLRPGERDPGNFVISPVARSRVGRQARTAGMRDLSEAAASGIDTPRTAAARENLPTDQLLALTDPSTRRLNPEDPRVAERRAAERTVEASHVPGVATEPHDAHTGRNVEIIPTEAHREGIHNLDTTRPLETATPNPDYAGRPGFHSRGGRAPPNPRTDRGVLRAAEADASRLERNFPGADPAEIAAGRQWLAERRAALRASGADNLTPPVARSPSDPAISSAPRSPGTDTTTSPPRYAPHTETARTPDRATAMAQYHDQVRTDPSRESGVWQGPDGTFYVMQGDSGSVRPPSAAGPLRLIYHSHPTSADTNYRGLVSQPSQAAGDFGVLQHQHGGGPAGARHDSELHFPVYDSNGGHSGYGATRFSYDPTSPLPLQVTTTTPGARPTTQRYVSFADYEARTGIRAGGDTPAASSAARVDADARLQTDVAAANQRIDSTSRALTGLAPIVGAREGRDVARQSAAREETSAESTLATSGRGPAYTAAIAGMAPGELFELPVNPAYPPPPGTTAELDALMDQVHAAQEAQTALMGTEHNMQRQADEQYTHEAELDEAMSVTDDLVSGRSEHQDAVDSTGEANDTMLGEAEETAAALGRSAQEAGALTTLVGSLKAFGGMADLFAYLPGDLGRQAAEARGDTNRLIESLNRVGETDAVQANVEAGRGEIEADAARVEGVSSTGTTTDEELTTGQTQVGDLQNANAVSLAETEATREQASSEGSAAATTEEDAQAAHDTLLSELQSWAQEHQQAREDAIASAMTEYEAMGLEAREST
jgi:hypothetical protein